MKKGFTLIELVAILVILGVIALITTPIIINITSRAEENTRVVSIIKYAEATKLAYTEELDNLTGKDLKELANLKMVDDKIVKCDGVVYTDSLGSILYDCTVNDMGNYCYLNGNVYNDVQNCNSIRKVAMTGTISKLDNTLMLSSNSGSYTYPTSGTFSVIKNVSGGTLTCVSSNTNVATCSISGTTITVTPGVTEGNATITVKSAETNNYKEAQATYVATMAKGVLSVTATGYSKAYDGLAHGITVTSSGATIKYGTSSGSYTLTSSPTYTNAGTYTVYYQVTKPGYKTVTGSKKVVISKANNTLMLSSNSGSYTYPTSGTFSVIKNVSGGTLTCVSSNTNVATCSISGTTVTVTPGVTEGNATITVKSAATSNYNVGQFTYIVSVSSPDRYEFGEPTSSSSTNYEDVIKSSGSNTFIKKSKGKLYACLVMANDFPTCWGGDKIDKTVIKEDISIDFGNDNCTYSGGDLDCHNSYGQVMFNDLGEEEFEIQITAGYYICLLTSGGSVNCYEW